MNDKLTKIKNILAFVGFLTIGNAVLLDTFVKKGPEGIIEENEEE